MAFLSLQSTQKQVTQEDGFIKVGTDMFIIIKQQVMLSYFPNIVDYVQITHIIDAAVTCFLWHINNLHNYGTKLKLFNLCKQVSMCTANNSITSNYCKYYKHWPFTMPDIMSRIRNNSD